MQKASLDFILCSLQAFRDLIMSSLLFNSVPSDAFGNTNVDVLSNLRGLTGKTEEVKGKERERRREHGTAERSERERRNGEKEERKWEG